ncbi:class I SAM-dependent methyltransferase [Candidatus Gracilibacteria bacterium]|nr:class I SAM-dependent methyltransferase [Candidatus Gracilibacteria bacterium]
MGRRHRFYLQLASDLGARTIIDLGCGTGMLTRALTGPHRQIIGVDPAPAMLAYAARQPGAERVRWINGDAHLLGTLDADLVVMTGHVAQIFLEDTDWQATLHAIHAAVRPGGHLAFESRNPEDRAWERWNRDATFTELDTPYGRVETWIEVHHVSDKRVRFAGYNRFCATGELVVVPSELRFRSLREIQESLHTAGLTITQVYSDWFRGPQTPTSRSIICVAQRGATEGSARAKEALCTPGSPPASPICSLMRRRPGGFGRRCAGTACRCCRRSGLLPRRTVCSSGWQRIWFLNTKSPHSHNQQNVAVAGELPRRFV